jgi:addiction module HigA family antidote
MAGRDPKRPPIHPGEILREDVFPALNMSVAAAAQHLGVTRQALHRVLNGTAAISPEMALRIGKFCGNGPEFWLRLQGAYDLWHAHKRLAAEIATIEKANIDRSQKQSIKPKEPSQTQNKRPRTRASISKKIAA